MAVKKTERTNQGVYQATLIGPRAKMEKPENWPWPKMYVEFEISGGAKVLWSEDVGKDLYYLVRALTGKSLPTELFQSDNQTVFDTCLQALAGASFTGLVRVNKDGWIDQPAVPGGPQLWRFVDIQTRTKEGIVTSIETNDVYKPGETYRFVVWRSEIVAGKYSGYTHSQFLRLPKFSIDEDGDLMVDDRAALYKFLMETGVGSMEDFRFNQDCDNIWPMTQHLAQKAAGNGFLFHGTAFKTDDKKAGGMDWNTLMAADLNTVSGDILPITVWDSAATSQSAQQPAAAQTAVSDTATIERINGQVVTQLNVIAGKLGLEGKFTCEVRDDGTAPDFEIPAWAVLYPHFIEPICAILPLPVPYGWPPMSRTEMNWGEFAASRFVEILLHFANMPDEKLASFIGEGKADVLNQELQGVFLSPKPVAAAVQMGAVSKPVAAVLGGTNEPDEEDEEDSNPGEVEEDAIPF